MRAAASGCVLLRRLVVPLLMSLVLATAAGARAAQAQHVAPALDPGLAPDGTSSDQPFATSLQIASPGPQAEANGLSYRFTLTWSARAGAGAYRVFMWTDAARTWYRIAQTTGTTTDAHAFRSGCTAFMVIAFADTNAPGSSMTGLEASNVLRFPLSQQPSVCPMQHP
jgi:hypothetical protein